MSQEGYLRKFIVFHKDNPERKISFRTPKTMTLKQVKQKMVDAGFFARDIIKELRVERI